MFKSLESASTGTRLALEEAMGGLRFSQQGLIPAVAQQHDTGEVLMLAWMNMASIRETLATGDVCYWSRSRARLWRKGERSGQVQRLVELRVDCDGDTLLLLVDQRGPACHTGRRTCFYWKQVEGSLEVDVDPMVDPRQLYGDPAKPS